ncbi:glycosyltransferase [Armatimonas sp.]|uniref:glycosyltransferase n=1 Tax=Armatimonas sp. TaxID=1872638 RepID=UPI00374CE5A7
MRVLFVSCDPLDGAVTRYRCTHLAEALRSAGHTADVATIYDPVIRLEHDIVVLHRICANQEGQALADAVRKSGATLVYGADDLVWEVPSGHLPRMLVPRSVPSSPVARSSREEGLAELHLAMIRQADGVLVNTVFSSCLVSDLGKDNSIVRNFLSQEQWRLSKQARESKSTHEGVRLGYLSGTPTHDDDLAAIASDLENVLNRYPQVELWIVGPVSVPENLKSFGSRILRKSFVSWRELPQLICEVDICLTPLAETRFNRAKSELKFLEAGAVGVPTVASFWGGFESIGGFGCKLVSRAIRWETMLVELIDDESIRHMQGQKALEGVRELCGVAMDFAVYFFEDRFDGRRAKLTQSVTFSNPRGFTKGLVKQALRRLKP